MSPDRLRQAAAKIRETARAATQGAWFAGRKQDGDESGPLPYDYVTGDVFADDGQGWPDDVVLGALPADAALITLMASPPVALAVADWLDNSARVADIEPSIEPEAFTVANLILCGAEMTGTGLPRLAASMSAQDDARLLALSRWVDGSPRNRDRDPEARLWSRVTKVCEESGEVWRALSAYVGENPRKGIGTQQDIEDELLDTAAAALAAVAHLHDNDPSVSPTALLSARLQATTIRAGVGA
jgi:NTP pyrophosphatase (non-canonical NTP hydrolase)